MGYLAHWMAEPGIGKQVGRNTDAGDELKSFIERIERSEEQKAVITADIKQIYAEAKGVGFDTKTMRKVIRERKKEPHERREERALLDLYCHALGMEE